MTGHTKRLIPLHDSYAWPTIGFLASIALTLFAFQSRDMMTIILAAVLQLAVQMYFFIHVGTGNERRWNILAGTFTFVLLGSIVIGTIWIMNHLRDNMMPVSPSKMYIDGKITPLNEKRP